MEENKITEFNDSHVGKYITCYISGTCINDARVQKQGNSYYICQNSIDGDRCNDKLGYKYSWLVYDGTLSMISANSVTKIFLKESVKQKLKPGDIVRFIYSGSSNAKYFSKGHFGLEIFEVYGDTCSVFERDKSDSWNVRKDELELDQANAYNRSEKISTEYFRFTPNSTVKFKEKSINYNLFSSDNGEYLTMIEYKNPVLKRKIVRLRGANSGEWEACEDELIFQHETRHEFETTTGYRSEPDELERYSESGFFEKMKDLGKQDVEEIKVEHKKKPKRYVQIENMDNIN